LFIKTSSSIKIHFSKKKNTKKLKIYFKVVSLPSQICISKQKISDSLGASASNVLRAAVVKIAG